ncbi:MAG: heme exporter protein D [Pseudohongiellaceae bacterium]
MNFQTLTEFFLMGGHALYVWLSYGVGLFIIVLVYIQPIIARRTIMRDLSQRQRREAQHNKVANEKVAQDNAGGTE